MYPNVGRYQKAVAKDKDRRDRALSVELLSGLTGSLSSSKNLTRDAAARSFSEAMLELDDDDEAHDDAEGAASTPESTVGGVGIEASGDAGRDPTLKAGWEEHYSEKHQLPYYYNIETNQTVWTKPLAQVEPRWAEVEKRAVDAASAHRSALPAAAHTESIKTLKRRSTWQAARTSAGSTYFYHQ